MSKLYHKSNKLKIGDVVIHISGGPLMTINQIYSSIECMWFDNDYILHKQNFSKNELRPLHKEVKQ